MTKKDIAKRLVYELNISNQLAASILEITLEILKKKYA